MSDFDSMDRMQLIEELEEFEALFALQRTRMNEATALWRAENPKERALVLPDLGNLLKWLMDRYSKLEEEVKIRDIEETERQEHNDYGEYDGEIYGTHILEYIP